ncbi:MAG: hypothetical protein WCR49_10325, partial [Opitutae bacterium]
RFDQLKVPSQSRDDEAIQLFVYAQSREPVKRLDRHGALRAPRDDKSLKAEGRWYKSFRVSAPPRFRDLPWLVTNQTYSPF